MDNPAVINASPLIFFSRGQKMDLLHHFAGPIFVPAPVAHEIRMRGPQDITAKSLENTSWLKIVASPPTPELISDWAFQNLRSGLYLSRQILDEALRRVGE